MIKLRGNQKMQVVSDKQELQKLTASCPAYLHVWLCSVKSDSCDPTDCSPPGSSVHGDSPGKSTGVGCHPLLQGIFLTQRSSTNSHVAVRFFTIRATREALYVA